MSDNKLQNSKQVYTKPKNRFIKSRAVAFIFLLVVVLVIGSLVAYRYVVAENCENRDNKLYDEIATVLKNENHNEMTRLAEKIKSKDGYSKDPHCAYGLIMTDLAKEDVAAAEKKYTSFIDDHSKATFSSSFEPLGVKDFVDARGKIDGRLSDIRGFFTITF